MFETPTRDRRAERHEATRAEILEAAWELVRANGLASLSLRDVARAVGMQAPSLYSYFDSKNAIYDAMYAEGCEAYLREAADIESTGDPVADLRAAWHFFVRFCTEDVARYQLIFQRTIPGFEPSAESFAIAEQGLDRLRALLESAGVDGQAMLDLATAIGTGIADQQISNDPGGDRWIRLIDDAVEMFVAHAANKTSKRRSKR